MEQFLRDFLVEQFKLGSSEAALVASVVPWSVIAILSTLLFYVLYLRKSFNDQVIYTGNKLAKKGEGGYTLELRTYRMVPVSDLFPTNVAFRINLAWKLFWLSKKDPFIKMSPRDMNVLQPRAINGLSELYPNGLMAWQAGAPTKTSKLLLAVSYEKHRGANSRTIRVIVSAEEELQEVLDPAVRQRIRFEHVHQRERLDTLVLMANYWKRERGLSPDAFRIVREMTVYS